MAFNSTTGIGVPAQIAVDSALVTLSLSGTTTHQISSNIQDATGTPVQAGTQFVLTAAATGGVYTGTVTGGGSNAFAGKDFTVAGFVNAPNNGTFTCTASTTTTLTLANAASVAETHAATATNQEPTAPTYVSYSAGVATVSATGLITAVAKGQATIEVSFPAFNNAFGNVASTGNIMNGLPLEKIFKEITVQVNP